MFSCERNPLRQLVMRIHRASRIVWGAEVYDVSDGFVIRERQITVGFIGIQITNFAVQHQVAVYINRINRIRNQHNIVI